MMPWAQFQQAWEQRYTWDRQFPGYRAEVLWQGAGEAVTAQVQVNRDGAITIAGLEVSHPVYYRLKALLQEVVAHRQPLPVPAQATFTAGEQLPNGALPIRVQETDYLIRGPVITQVRRQVGEQVCTVEALTIEQTPQGYFPIHYRVEMQDITTGQVQQVQEIWEHHARVGTYYLLRERRQRITQGEQTTEETVVFANLGLLGPEVDDAHSRNCGMG